MIKKNVKLILVGTAVRPIALQPANQHAVYHHLHPHHHPAPYPCQYHVHSQDPPVSQDVWDHPDFPDVVDFPVLPDVWDLWDQWDRPDHPAAPAFQHHLLLPVHRSAFITVWRSVLNHVVFRLLLQCIFLHHLHPQCLYVLQHVLLLVVNKQGTQKWFIDLPYGYNRKAWLGRKRFVVIFSVFIDFWGRQDVKVTINV